MQHNILEIEQICDSVKIIITRDGSISIAPLPGKEVAELTDLKMPPQEFWDNLSLLIKSISENLSQVSVRLQQANEQIMEMDKLLGEAQQKKKKIIPVNANKKQMFAAGVTFGKNIAKNRK